MFETKSNHQPLILAGLISAAMITMGITGLQSKTQDQWTLANESETLSIISKRYHLESPDIAMNEKGDVVIVWQEKRGRDYDIFAAKTHINRNRLDTPWQVNSFKKNDQKRPKVAMNEKGDFMVIWESYEQDGGESGIYGQRFSHKGEQWGVEFLINQTRKGNQNSPSISMNKAGEFIVGWIGDLKRIGTRGVFVKRYNQHAEAITEELRADTNVYKTVEDYKVLKNPQVSLNNFGTGIAIWQKEEESGIALYSRSFDNGGAPLSSTEVAVSNKLEGDQINPDINLFNGDQFLVVWEKNLEWKEHQNLQLIKESIESQIFASNGSKSGNPVAIIANFQGQDHPEIVPTEEGAVVVWQSNIRVREKTAGRELRQNAWSIMAQQVNKSGQLNGEAIELARNADQPFARTKASSNTGQTIGVVWKSRHPKKRQSIINFKQFWLTKQEVKN